MLKIEKLNSRQEYIKFIQTTKIFLDREPIKYPVRITIALDKESDGSRYGSKIYFEQTDYVYVYED